MKKLYPNVVSRRWNHEIRKRALAYMKSFGKIIARNMDKELIQDVLEPFSKFLRG